MVIFSFLSDTVKNREERLYKPDIDISLDWQKIEIANDFKYLGIWFNSRLNWSKHIAYLVKKCTRRINFLTTITGFWWGVHPTDLPRLYITTIRSVLEYGSICFHWAPKTLLIKLERFQYRCLTIAMGSKKSTHTVSLEMMSGVMLFKTRLNTFHSISYPLHSIKPGSNRKFWSLARVGIQNQNLDFLWWFCFTTDAP